MKPNDLYRLYDNTGRLLYIGITSRGPRRWREHMRDKPWWKDVETIHLEHHPNRTAVEQAELQAIKTERPLHNIAHKPEGDTPVPPSNLNTHPLVGRWFHGDHNRSWQGQIIGHIGDDRFLVQLYDWLVGYESDQKIVTTEDMSGWTFYDTDSDMQHAYEHGGVQQRWDRAKGLETCGTCRLPYEPGDGHPDRCAARKARVGRP